MTENLIERLCRYVRVDTQAVEGASTYPSSPGQLELGRQLVAELKALGLRDAVANEHGIVSASIPATVEKRGPTIAWFAHMDTSPETSGRDVKPNVLREYDGQDILLPGDRNKVIRVTDNPELLGLKGST